MGENHLAYGSQLRRDLTGPSVPTQQNWIIIKRIKVFNNSQVITTQNKKLFLKRLFENGFERD